MSRRTRLTITLREDLLRGIDALVDTREIRNRSHAIEVLLQRALGHRVRQAVILAGGEGVRLRPWTYELPKSLLPVGGRPLIAHAIELLRDHGIRDLVVVTGHLGARVEESLGLGADLGVRIQYVREASSIGTGGALRSAQAAVTTSPFLCLYGDVLADLDFTDFIRTHESSSGALATLALTSVADPSAYGSVRLHGTRITEFLEKPPRRLETSRLVFAGISVLDVEVFGYLPKRRVVSLERDVFPELIRRRVLYGYPFEGAWFDVSTAAVYERAVKTYGRRV